MGPRRYGRTSITLVDSVPASSTECSNRAEGSSSEAPGSSLQEVESCSSDAFHVPEMDGFDFSSSTSAWKPDAPAIAVARHGGGEQRLGKGGCSAMSSSEGIQATGGSGDRSAQSAQRVVSKCREATPVQQISTAFIGEHGEVRARLDDIEFALDGMQLSKSQDVQTSAILQFAELCRDAEMRQLLRAHSLVHKVVESLQSIVSSENGLMLPAAAILFYLCNDEANLLLIDVTACRTIIQILSSRSSTVLDPRSSAAGVRASPNYPDMSPTGAVDALVYQSTALERRT
jgi:hypothetical protein